LTTGTRKNARATPTPKTKRAEADTTKTTVHRMTRSRAIQKGPLGQDIDLK
jgi:hypothetical protein